jgi:hypothetical protein
MFSRRRVRTLVVNGSTNAADVQIVGGGKRHVTAGVIAELSNS